MPGSTSKMPFTQAQQARGTPSRRATAADVGERLLHIAEERCQEVQDAIHASAAGQRDRTITGLFTIWNIFIGSSCSLRFLCRISWDTLGGLVPGPDVSVHSQLKRAASPLERTRTWLKRQAPWKTSANYS